MSNVQEKLGVDKYRKFAISYWNMKDWNQLKRELLRNPKFKKLYEESQPEFEIAKAIIRAE